MKLAEISYLCDSIEIACLQLNRNLTAEDIFQELSLEYSDERIKESLRQEIGDAFGLAERRAKHSAEGYPFAVGHMNIESTSDSLDINPYLFLLLGSQLKRKPGADRKQIKLFERYFEDLVSWSFYHIGYKTSILSIPREERGLAKSLSAALKQIADKSGEPALLLDKKLDSDDKDLGVDIIAVGTTADEIRSGKPTYLVQCATGEIGSLSEKILETQKIFHTIWDNGFYRSSTVPAVATPDDLLTLEPIDWDRLCQLGWVLDRTRITKLFGHNTGTPDNHDQIEGFWHTLIDSLADINWRSNWKNIKKRRVRD